VLVVVGLIAIVFARLKLPELKEKMQQATSDSGDTKGTLRVGYDSWVGYFPLCSPEMRRRLRVNGYRLQCEDDNADYAQRFTKLKEHNLEFAAATVDSYILNGQDTGYPGVIVGVIDESKGGDAIVANAESIPDLDAIKTNPIAIAYTPNSPSEQLLKAMSTYFDLPLYDRGNLSWQIQTNGSEEALKRLQKGKANVAVLWEPDVSRALANPKFKKLIGTDETDKLIVDILLVDRQFGAENPTQIAIFLQAYFETLKFYNDNPDELLSDLKSATRLQEPQIEAMLQGVAWAGVVDNGLDWFGGAQNVPGASDSLVDAINTAIEILLDNGDFSANPLPNSDPYRIINSQFINALYAKSGAGTGVTANTSKPLAGDFAPLSASAWAQLKEVGTLRVEPVSFRRGTNSLDLDGNRAVDRIADKIKRYPKFRIVVAGHSGLSGDPSANLELSTTRAAAVANYLAQNYDVDPDRMRAAGFGSSRPLERKPGESNRAYGYRLPRVEISLVRENF